MNIKSFVLNTFLLDLQQIYRLYLDKLDKKQVSLKLFSPDDNIYVYTDREKITQILFNLLAHVAKPISEGEISFGYNRLSNTDIELFVSHKGNNYQGVKKKDNFNRFLWIGNDNASAFRGLSFSELSMVKLLADELGGKISFDSNQSEGNTFRFELGHVVDENLAEPVVSQSVKNNSGSKIKILTADDDEYSMTLITHILKKLDLEYLKASNGKEALEIVEEDPRINLVLMDISMPVMDGFDAMLGINIINPAIPVIAISAYPVSEYREKAIKAGFKDYLAKPIQKDTLFNCLNKYLFLQPKIAV